MRSAMQMVSLERSPNPRRFKVLVDVVGVKAESLTHQKGWKFSFTYKPVNGSAADNEQGGKVIHCEQVAWLCARVCLHNGDLSTPLATRAGGAT